MAAIGSGWDGEHPDDALLSAYLDGEVEDAATRDAVRRHLAGCPACRQALAELEGLVASLGALAEPPLPRSFALTPEMVPLRLPRRDPWYLRLQPAVRAVGALAAVLLVFVLVGDALTHPAAPASTPPMSAAGGASATGGVAAPQSLASTAPARPMATAQVPGTGETSARVAGEVTGAEAPSSAQPPPQESSASASTPAADAAASTEASPTTISGAGPVVEGGGPITGEPTAPVDQESRTREVAPRSPGGGPSLWRLAEVTLTLVVAWSLVVGVALPRLAGRG